MGLVAGDGAISGFLPSAEAFAVHYPGYPSCTARALLTLGGVSEIAQTRSSQPSPLELRFRPEDPYSHPAFGQLRPCAGLLLRVSRKKAEGDAGSSAAVGAELGGDGAGMLSADVVARVPQAYEFDGMVDYQHVIPVHAAQRKKRNWNELEPSFEKNGLMDLDEEDILMLVPSFFTLKDIPQDLVLKPSELSLAKRKMVDAVKEKWEMEIEPCLALDFTKKKIPEKINWECHLHQGTLEWEQQVAMVKLFEEKPIWPRRSLKERLLYDGLHVKDECFKRLLFRSAYYFSRGPFRGFWIRKGYDPRQDSDSRIYQRIDFRIPSQMLKIGQTVSVNGSGPSWKEICEFRAFPSKTFSTLQLFELADDFIQEEIRKPVQQTICTLYTGWFPKANFATLMLRVKMRFMSLCNICGSKDIVKLISQKFEKSKLSQVLEKNLRPDKVDDYLHATKDNEVTNDKINHDDEGEHNELDEEDYYEASDDDEPYQMDCENEDFSLQEDARLDAVPDANLLNLGLELAMDKHWPVIPQTGFFNKNYIPSKYMHKILKSLPFYGKGMNFSERDKNINGGDDNDDDAENDDSDGEYCTLEPLSDDEHVEDDDNADDD